MIHFCLPDMYINRPKSFSPPPPPNSCDSNSPCDIRPLYSSSTKLTDKYVIKIKCQKCFTNDKFCIPDMYINRPKSFSSPPPPPNNSCDSNSHVLRLAIMSWKSYWYYILQAQCSQTVNWHISLTPISISELLCYVTYVTYITYILTLIGKSTGNQLNIPGEWVSGRIPVNTHTKPRQFLRKCFTAHHT